MGSHPGTLSGMPNVSEPLFCAPITSPEMRGVVGTPLFILMMPPNSHPLSTPRANPVRGPGTCQSTKSVPARMIEDSVLDQLRTALRAQETREQLNVAEAEWQALEEGHCGLVRALVKEVRYDVVRIRMDSAS